MRLTKDNVEKILKENEGFKRETYYKSKNFTQSCVYKVHDGTLTVNRSGKTSWADSRFNKDEICDMDQTRQFIRKYLI